MHARREPPERRATSNSVIHKAQTRVRPYSVALAVACQGPGGIGSRRPSRLVARPEGISHVMEGDHECVGGKLCGFEPEVAVEGCGAVVERLHGDGAHRELVGCFEDSLQRIEQQASAEASAWWLLATARRAMSATGIGKCRRLPARVRPGRTDAHGAMLRAGFWTRGVFRRCGTAGSGRLSSADPLCCCRSHASTSEMR